MSFPKYPMYKNSGVEWLGDVPDSWKVTTLGRATIEKCDGPFGSGLKSEHYTDIGVRVIRLQNIRGNRFDGSDEAFISQQYYQQELNGHDVRAGDLLIAGLGDERNTVGRACIAPANVEPAMVKADCFRFRLDRAFVVPSFIAAQLTAGASSDAGILSSGSTRSRIPLSVMASRKIAIPALEEQKAISSFLTREMVKIDGLVTEQHRLIELLKEKRQAIISHAVTKGLNSHATMKPSGIEWLGDVPKHWSLRPVKYAVQFRSGGTPSKVQLEYWDGDVPWASSKDLKTEELADTEDHITQRAINDGAASLVPVGSVLVVVRGMILMHTFPVTKTLVPMAINQDLKAITPTAEIDGDFLAWILRGTSHATLGRVNEAAHGTKVLRLEDWSSMVLPIPPKVEQQQIVASLTTQLEELDRLHEAALSAINLLAERRSALISAAVTGKIDVRNLVATEAA